MMDGRAHTLFINQTPQPKFGRQLAAVKPNLARGMRWLEKAVRKATGAYL
jgi:hypothetical protein